MKNNPDLLHENIDLQKMVADKDDIILAQEQSLQEKEKSLHSKEKRIRILEEYILSFQQKQFGSSSEKQEGLQAELVFTEAEDTAETEAPEQADAFADDTMVVAEHKRKKKRVSIPKELPRIEIIHDLSNDQKCCPHDGTELLRDFSGALMTDGYAAYNAPCEKNNITHLAYWAHARRKFIDAQKIQKAGKTGKADQALAFIQQLYGIEKVIKDKTPAEKHQNRQTQSLPVLQKLKSWLDKSLSHAPPQSLIGKALHYLHEQWPKLIRYVESGHYPIDNNAAENAIRPFVIGRKHWLFSSSPKGAVASANLYSVIETAKANGLEPYAYLRKIFTELPQATTLEQIEALLPWNCKSTVG